MKMEIAQVRAARAEMRLSMEFGCRFFEGFLGYFWESNLQFDYSKIV